jgi:hypothetical protein
MRRFGLGVTLIGSILVMGTATLMIPLARGSVVAATAFLMAAQVGDVGWPIYDVCELSLRQAITPDDLLGRVNAVMQMLFRGLLPVGSICARGISRIDGNASNIKSWFRRFNAVESTASFLACSDNARVSDFRCL